MAFDKDFLAAIGPAHRRGGIALCAVASVLMPGGAVLDLMVYPERMWTLLALRLAASLMCLIGLVITVRGHGFHSSMAGMGCAILGCSSSIAVMTHLTGGSSSTYYAGLSLCMLAMVAATVWPVWLALAICATCISSYLVPIFFLEPTIDFGAITNALFFMLSTGILTVTALYARNRLTIQEYESQRALASSNATLQEMHAVKDQLFQNLSHEFRTPLTLILAPSDAMLEDEALSEKNRERVSMIRHNGLRMLNLINDLLDLAKLDAVGLVFEKHPVDVAARVTHIANDARELATRGRITLVAEIASGMSRYLLDDKHLDKVLLNLISNALKFTPPEGTVTIRAQERDDALVLEIADTGPGIPEDARTKIFERFRQVDGSTTRRFGGTGIGLALVKELTEGMGGRIELESRADVGSTFRVVFPRALATDRATDAATASTEPVSASASVNRRAAFAALTPRFVKALPHETGTRGARILVAEDEPELRRMIRSLLCDDNYRVTTVDNGLDALSAARHSPPHLVLSDVMMPGLDGVQLCAALRDTPNTRDLPIILLSAKADLDDRIRGRKVGADTYLTKPFHPRELLAAIEGCLRSRMRIVGDYVLHTRLGAGGQSEVYYAEHRSTGEWVALKLIAREVTEDADARLRLEREATALSRINHPNVVRILHQGAQEGQSFLVMEYLDGASLAEIADDDRAISAQAAVEIATAVADALDAVHRADLIHRDIKLGNVMVLRREGTLEERVRIVDFGIVRGDERTISDEGSLIGTVPYLSPELLEGLPPTPQDDLYALGVLIYRLCTGSLPRRASDFAEHQRLAKVPPKRASEHVPALAGPLEDLLVRALGPLEQRFSSARQMHSALVALELERGTLDLPSAKLEMQNMESTATT